MSKFIEIMSPVGSFESLMAAIQGGANSVYFGVGKLNMRSRSSQNFTLDDLDQIVEIAKDHQIKTYLALNTIIYDEEMTEMQTTLQRAKDAGITAVIASDLSVIDYAHSQGIEVHISTQCNITNLQAVKFFSRYADVIVTARELSLRQVADIVEGIEREQIKGPSGNLVEIEVFVHGALCMAVSGKCYLSLDNMNHSANRGACLQLCRRGYTVKDKEGEFELDIENEYIMSPKDLCTLEFIDKIVKAGVTVFKIEGRGRGPEYVKTVTRVYRQAADACLNGTFTRDKVDKWLVDLKKVYNRGFWDGYYLGRKMGEWTERYGSQATQKKVYVGKVTNYFTKLGVAEVKMETGELHSDDEIYITGPTTGVLEMKPGEIRVELKPAERTVKGEMCSFAVPDVIRRGDKIYKIVEVEDEF
ncbi:MAG: U32 family peptidase [Bacteroidetes bacterium]|nr:MAG: U32 family peptidase [Bacteroidota bacterium]